MADNINEPGWERKILEKVALESIAEQRRRRRWGIFFKLLGFVYLLVLLAVFGDWGGAERLTDGKNHTALVQLDGVIQAKGEANAEDIIAGLQSAFKDKGTRGVVLQINSPGGSPVQAGMISDEIVRLRKKYPAIPLHVVVEDVCASGGYYIAAAADKIYVDKASLIGSIGVLMDGFGFTGSMEKLGIERRLLTAGDNKGMLDPFSPQSAEQKAYALGLLDEIHQQFIDVVRKGRGSRLKETPDTFSGLMWTGAKSIELGLADAYGTTEFVAREVFRAEDILDYTVKPNFAEQFAQKFGASMAEGATSMLTRFSLR